MNFLLNAIELAAVGAATGMVMVCFGAFVQGRKAFEGCWYLVGTLAMLGVLAASPSLITDERYVPLASDCPRALVGSSC